MNIPKTVPVASGIVLGASLPKLRSVGRVTLVEQTERVQTVSVSSTFGTGPFNLTPANVGPWLAGVAKNWSKYRWLRLRLLYIPTCETAVKGAIYMGLQYDNVDTAPTSATQMSSMQSFITGPVWSGAEGGKSLASINTPIPESAIFVEVDCQRFSRPWYPYATTATITAQTAIAASLGNEYIPARCVVAGGDGAGAAVNVGAIYAQYLIELIEPQDPSLNA